MKMKKNSGTSLVGKTNIQIEKAPKESTNISSSFMKKNWEGVNAGGGDSIEVGLGSSWKDLKNSKLTWRQCTDD
jgi:hypothetical protein